MKKPWPEFEEIMTEDEEDMTEWAHLSRAEYDEARATVNALHKLKSDLKTAGAIPFNILCDRCGKPIRYWANFFLPKRLTLPSKTEIRIDVHKCKKRKQDAKEGR